MGRYWTEDEANAALSAHGRICNMGQIDARLARALDRRVKAGELAKRRGYWNERGGLGLGPLKTIWELPSPTLTESHPA